MPHVVTDNCSACRYTECVAICPVDCFHAADDRLYIDPEVCIDCAACVPVCPVKAIVDAFDVESGAEELIALNRKMAGALPVIADKTAPLPGADARRAALGY